MMQYRYCFFLLVVITCLMMGCSTTSKVPDPNYMAYQQAMSNQKPMIVIEWTDDGLKMKRLEVSHPMNIQQIQPEQPHPAWKVTEALVRGATVVGGIWAAGDALQGLAGSVQGNTNITAGGNVAGGSISIPTTTTTTATTTNSIEQNTSAAAPTEPVIP